MERFEFDWDDGKSQQLKENRGYSLDEVVALFEAPFTNSVKQEDPQQFLAIGYLRDQMLSVVYEERQDDEGEYLWLVTYWKSTKRERKLYEQYFGRRDGADG